MATKKTVKAEEPQEENQEVQTEVKAEEVVTKEIKVDPEEIVLENPVREPVLRDGDLEEAEEDPKTFDDVYEVLEDISGKLDVIIRGL